MSQQQSYVYCIHWNEGSFPQVEVFDEHKVAEDFAAYIKATRGAGTVLNTLKVRGRLYVETLTGLVGWADEGHVSHANEVLREHGFPELRKG